MTVTRWLISTLLALTLVPMIGAGSAAAADLVDEHWRSHDPQSEETVDHSLWDGLLKRYVVRDEALKLNRLRYGAVSEADHGDLKDYLDMLQDIEVTALNRSEQKAYWINLYNAYTVDIILDNYPVASIRKIGGNFLARAANKGGPWSDEGFTVTVEDRALTLDQIEHGILRPLFEDPRIHYGVNCASVGCPNLDRDAYTGATVDDQLTENAKTFIDSPRGLQQVSGDGATVSSIYVWFQDDFGGDDAGVIAHMKRYGGEAVEDRLKGVVRIRGHRYDWSLNDVNSES